MLYHLFNLDLETAPLYIWHQLCGENYSGIFITFFPRSTLENDKAVENVLASKGKQKTELISQMLEDEKYQREAFQALLLQQDHRAVQIGEQMSRIQNELAALTVVEMKKRDMKVGLEALSIKI